MGTKFCIHCKLDIEVTLFGSDSSTPDGLRRWCKSCTNESHREKYVPDKRFEKGLQKRYGMSAAQYLAIRKSQGNRCPICGAAPERLVVDHDHETGQVRGLPCRQCNFMLGNCKESPEVLRQAADYLEHRLKYPLMIPWREAMKIINEQDTNGR